MRSHASVTFARKRAARALHHLGIFGWFASQEIPAAVINVSTLAYAPVSWPDKGLESTATCRPFPQTLCQNVSSTIKPLRFRKARESRRVLSSSAVFSLGNVAENSEDFTWKFCTLVIFNDNYNVEEAPRYLKNKEENRSSAMNNIHLYHAFFRIFCTSSIKFRRLHLFLQILHETHYVLLQESLSQFLSRLSALSCKISTCPRPLYIIDFSTRITTSKTNIISFRYHCIFLVSMLFNLFSYIYLLFSKI